GFQALEQAHVQEGQGFVQVLGPVPQHGDGVVGAGVVHRNELILLKVGIQLLGQHLEELDRAHAVIVQIDHRGDKVFFLVCCHCASTSSKSYTVLILPESTL